MKTEDYPALYQLANTTSLKAQRRHLGNVRAHGYTLIGAAIASALGSHSYNSSISSGFLILMSIGLTLLIFFKKNEKYWYDARALAESVKTSTWRFMMKAAPYNDGKAKEKFVSQLTKLHKEHKDLASELAQNIGPTDQVTKKMKQVHGLSIRERKDFYSNYRVKEQLDWYEDKAIKNAKHEKFWFIAILTLQILAIVLVIFRIYSPEYKLWPVEAILITASVMFGWVQVKRFRELSAAYALTAIDISLLKEDMENINENERSLSKFVSDSESAFSREHTQWLARKDYIK